jgi:hypothetical protein
MELSEECVDPQDARGVEDECTGEKAEGPETVIVGGMGMNHWMRTTVGGSRTRQTRETISKVQKKR